MYKHVICALLITLCVFPALSVDILGTHADVRDMYDTVVSGDISGVKTLKISFAKSDVTYQYRNADVIIFDSQESNTDIVQYSFDYIEGYYTYGKSSTYPWGIYWCIHDIGGKPMLVYAEFSGRKVWYAPVGQKTVDMLTASLDKGELPDISIIHAAVGA